MDYHSAPKVNQTGVAVTTDWLVSSAKARGKKITNVAKALTDIANQQIHEGKSPYHHRPLINLFLEEGQCPSVGVELETEERRGIKIDTMLKTLKSNWFHFESDSSLCTARTQGYELITEPLPPRAYRNPRLWAGLQNLLTPWVESYGYEQTGLHVHVGIDMFESCDLLPFVHKADRRMLGKYIAAAVYYVLLPRAFVDKVMLRSNTRYCAQTSCPSIDRIRNQLFANKSATGYDVINIVSEELLRRAPGTHISNINTGGCLRSIDTNPRYLEQHFESFNGHGAEVNASPVYTIEFRRGKGTLHSLSIHRMVELASLVVRYAWRIAREPHITVSTDDVLAFIERSTTNNALKTMARDARAK